MEGSDKHNSGHIIPVQIHQQTYYIRSSEDPEYIQTLARYVDERMQEISRETATVDTLKIAVLAALQIADEYFSTRHRLHKVEGELQEKGKLWLETLEPLLPPGAA